MQPLVDGALRRNDSHDEHVVGDQHVHVEQKEAEAATLPRIPATHLFLGKGQPRISKIWLEASRQTATSTQRKLQSQMWCDLVPPMGA